MTVLTRSFVMRRLVITVFLVALLPEMFGESSTVPAALIKIDASKVSTPDPAVLDRMGGTSPSGHTIVVTNRYLKLDGKPWLPVMGEFHFTRYPEQFWEEELLKMKAGGVQIVATYLFWNHHEEIQGQFQWSGRHDLRRFLELCQKHHLYVFLRLGPYSHGEARNGGLPDWVLAASPTRVNNPIYLQHVRNYFAQLGRQVEGLSWQDGGPIIGLQLENEYSKRGPSAGAAHILELKKIARDCGMTAPLYTVTGWDNPAFPAGEVIPVFGGYPDEFWQSTLSDLPASAYYLFDPSRADTSGVAGEVQSNVSLPTPPYPFFLAEAGGGIEAAYHRRPVINGDDIGAFTLTHLGSGANLYGYYMYQGGSNPPGQLTTLQESEASDRFQDLPVVSYDFQAPLGEFGQMNPPFRQTKIFHLFLRDFGSELAPMVAVAPDQRPSGPEDKSLPRVAARTDGRRGFVFVNNYQRMYPLPDQLGVQVQFKLRNEIITLPRKPVNIPSGGYFMWPVNLELSGSIMKYATAQLLTKSQIGPVDCDVFFATPGVATEFVFDRRTVKSVRSTSGSISRRQSEIDISRITPGPGVALTIETRAARRLEIIVLNREQALNTWKASIGGRDYTFLSSGDMFFSDESAHLRAREIERLQFGVLPDLPSTMRSSSPLERKGREGVFFQYAAKVREKHLVVNWAKTREPISSIPVRKGQHNAIAPNEADFERSARWQISLPSNAMGGLSDIFLRIKYQGDVARLYAGDSLLADDFYNGQTWEIGLKRFTKEAFEEKGLSLQIMPLRRDAPVYIPRDAWPTFPQSGEVAEVESIEAAPEYGIRIQPAEGGNKPLLRRFQSTH